MEDIRINDFSKFGERANHRLIVVLTKSQKERIKMLTEASGFSTMSGFVRYQLLHPSFEMKLNEILKTLKEIQEKIPPRKCQIPIDEPRCKK